MNKAVSLVTEKNKGALIRKDEEPEGRLAAEEGRGAGIPERSYRRACKSRTAASAGDGPRPDQQECRRAGPEGETARRGEEDS